jgi:hypothetical protein
MTQYYENTSRIYTGVCALTAAPERLGGPLICRRLILVAAADATNPVIVPQGQPAAAGFPIPKISADGSHQALELFVNDVSVVHVAGSGNVYWYVELP